MKDVTSHHLFCRKGTWYYRRRVPQHLVAVLGRPVIQHSLNTKDKKTAVKLREVEDIKWSAQFAAAEASQHKPSENQPTMELSPGTAMALVRDYVEATDRGFQEWLRDNPATRDDRADMVQEAEMGLSCLRDPDNLHGQEWIATAADQLLKRSGLDTGVLAGNPDTGFVELVRRALVELSRRKLARYDDRYERSFFDDAFNPDRPTPITFRELADQYLEQEIEASEVNGHAQKWIDKIGAQVALVRELIGDVTPVHEIDYDACLRARSLLARTPSNRTKLYPKLSLEAAIARAAADGKPLLSATTQAQYLNVLRDILELAMLKRLLPSNPAQTLRPLRRDDVKASDKRLPFTLDQIKAFFASEFYRNCAPGAATPYTKPDRDWRFWLPLLSLFMGMRPNEVCQMLVSDIKRTKNGTWYVDIVASTDEDEGEVLGGAGKTIKTGASRRKIPIHPKLIALGFLAFVQSRQEAGGGRLFQGIKPDKYGNLAAYPLRRFRESFLSAAISMVKRQSFYSFRHSFRDALRRCNAPPSALQALGGWSQGSLTSDAYGDKFDPDYQREWIEKVQYPGLDLGVLHQPDAAAIKSCGQEPIS